MEGCALCGKRARMLCESDQAKLCWDCDRKVHGANFLVAKHSRILLCRLCQSPTPWKASGPTLTPTRSVCYRCLSSDHHHSHPHDHDDDDGYYTNSDDADSDDDDNHYDDSEREEEEEGENQVVPWSSASASASVSASPPPLPVASSTNSDADGDISSATGRTRLPSKRFPDNSFNDDSDDERGCFSYEMLRNDESSSMSMFRPLKQPRINQREAALHSGTVRDGE